MYELPTSLKLLRGEAHHNIHKDLARKIGLLEAFMYGDFLNKVEMHKKELTEDGFFFYTVDLCEHETTLSKKVQTSLIKKLIDLNLVEQKVMGLPPKRYFRINPDASILFDILESGDKNPIPTKRRNPHRSQLCPKGTIEKTPQESHAAIVPKRHIKLCPKGTIKSYLRGKSTFIYKKNNLEKTIRKNYADFSSNGNEKPPGLKPTRFGLKPSAKSINQVSEDQLQSLSTPSPVGSRVLETPLKPPDPPCPPSAPRAQQNEDKPIIPFLGKRNNKKHEEFQQRYMGVATKYMTTPELRSALLDFGRHLMEVNCLHGRTSLSGMFEQLCKVPEAGRVSVIQETIENGWKSLSFASRGYGQKQTGYSRTHDMEFEDDEEDLKWR